MADSRSLQFGTKLGAGRYRLTKSLGRGGMGQVFSESQACRRSAVATLEMLSSALSQSYWSNTLKAIRFTDTSRGNGGSFDLGLVTMGLTEGLPASASPR